MIIGMVVAIAFLIASFVYDHNARRKAEEEATAELSEYTITDGQTYDTGISAVSYEEAEQFVENQKNNMTAYLTDNGFKTFALANYEPDDNMDQSLGEYISVTQDENNAEEVREMSNAIKSEYPSEHPLTANGYDVVNDDVVLFLMTDGQNNYRAYIDGDTLYLEVSQCQTSGEVGDENLSLEENITIEEN